MTATRSRAPVRPRKRFGQHFLGPLWAQKVVAAIAPSPGDVFIEIGPGTGAMTLPLAATGAPVLAVEIDRDLARTLAERAPQNVTVLTGDFLKLDVMPFLRGLEPQRPLRSENADVPGRRYRAVGNLPYNLSTPILFRLIDLHRTNPLLTDATIMLQREVAERLTAKPGTKAYGVLTITAQLHASIERVLDLPPGAFQPAPKVHSAVVRLAFYDSPPVRIVDEQLFAKLVRALFSQRRKTLNNALRRFGPDAHLVLAMAGFDRQRRPGTLDVREIARLVELLSLQLR